MKRTSLLKSLRIAVVLLAGVLLGASSSSALDLAAVEGQWTPPEGGAPITMWGFISDPDHLGSCPAGPVAWDVGPLLTEIPGVNPVPGSTLTVSLRNCLSEPVSIVIPGQNAILNPVGSPRVTSFTHEAPAAVGLVGGLASYTWTNLKAGTFLYQSGSHPAKQVHMGLYGALTVGTNSEALGGEVMVLFSEIDPVLHSGTPAAATPLTYKPKYFLVNGDAHSSADPVPVVTQGLTTKKNLLIRFLNAGLMSHVPVLQGPHMKIIAEDGNPYPYPREQYSVLLAAGKTLDALWHPYQTGTYALYDRSLSLSNNGVPGGGMLVYLAVDIGPFSWPMFIPAITNAGSRAGL